MEYQIVDEDQIPEELLTAIEYGQVIQIASHIGWLDCDRIPEFRCGNTYKIKE